MHMHTHTHTVTYIYKCINWTALSLEGNWQSEQNISEQFHLV